MKELKRWAQLNKVFLLAIALMIFFAWMDSKQIVPFHTINTEQGWELYNNFTGPAIWITWYVVFAVIGIIWYIYSKDKSEAVALTVAMWIMLFFATQDVFYFVWGNMFFSEHANYVMTDNMCWADMMLPVRTVSDVLGEECPSAFAFKLSAFIGMVLAYFVFNKLKRARW